MSVMAILRQLRRSPTGISDHFRFANQPQAQCPRVDHNRDCMPDSRPHIASGRSNSIDWKWEASRRHSTASIHLRILQPAVSSTTRYGTG